MVARITQPRVAPTLLAPCAPAPTALVTGTRVGSYTIERKLAEGGMAIVYEAVHQVLPRRAALKVMKDVSLGESARTRFLREACLLADLRHRAIVEVQDAGMLSDGRPWLGMNLIAGPTLADRLLVRGALGAGEVVELVRHIAGALTCAHQAGVVHRDLKPDNVIIVDDPRCPVRVIDWGIAFPLRPTDERLTVDGTITGTPHYMAPEQIRGELVDGTCDVYALGVVMYELLSGRPPFSGGMMDVIAQQLTSSAPPLGVQAPATPVWLAALVDMMLAKDRAQRPTMAQVVATLDGLTSGLALPQDDDEEDFVTDLIADTAVDDADRELDQLIAELSSP